MNGLTERFAEQIAGSLECLDRVPIQGTLPTACYADGMTRFLSARKIRIFDYFDFSKPLEQDIRQNAERIAAAAGREQIEFIRKLKAFRKEDRIQEILAERGDHPGLVHVFSAMESCSSYQPWHDKQTHRTFLKPDGGKCLHYYYYFYYYFIDEEFGLCYLRVPTWCPYRLQFSFNGHNWLARQLDKRGIGYQMLDNAFLEIDDWEQAQRLAERFDVRTRHRLLDRYAARFCPVGQTFAKTYHWSLMQAEYATDIVFRTADDLAPVSEEITRTAIHAVKADQVATFLGKKLHGNYEAEMGTHFQTRIEGTCIKHHAGRKAAIKRSDKFGRIRRMETTVNDVGFFRHYRRVEHRDGTSSRKQAPVQKTIDSLPVLRELCSAANRRYLQFVSTLQDPSHGVKKMRKIAQPVRAAGRDHPSGGARRGFNLLDPRDEDLFQVVARGEHHISGFTNRSLPTVLTHKTSSQISRLLKRLRTHGLIKKIGRTYKYYLTKLGQAAIVAALKLRETLIVPAFLTQTANA
ncbi:MAG: MarR family transcriptional regulator [Planctomycetes bacterium]|nr:MarR family transcriptional regulator [Planctomycetota bacterium]